MNTVLTSGVKGAVASLAIVASIHSAPASAETSDVPIATVSYADLNLATTDGAHQLYRRIALAADRVCPTDDTRNLSALARARSCRAEAISRAVRSVNNTQLAAVYAERVNRG